MPHLTFYFCFLFLFYFFVHEALGYGYAEMADLLGKEKLLLV